TASRSRDGRAASAGRGKCRDGCTSRLGGGAQDGRRSEAGSPRLAGQAAIRGELSEWPEGGFGVRGVEIVFVLLASQDAVNAGGEQLRGAVLGDVRVAGITKGGGRSAPQRCRERPPEGRGQPAGLLVLRPLLGQRPFLCGCALPLDLG